MSFDFILIIYTYKRFKIYLRIYTFDESYLFTNTFLNQLTNRICYFKYYAQRITFFFFKGFDLNFYVPGSIWIKLHFL